MDYNDIKNIDISKIDKNKCFLHYTNKNNIDRFRVCVTVFLWRM